MELATENKKPVPPIFFNQDKKNQGRKDKGRTIVLGENYDADKANDIEHVQEMTEAIKSHLIFSANQNVRAGIAPPQKSVFKPSRHMTAPTDQASKDYFKSVLYDVLEGVGTPALDGNPYLPSTGAYVNPNNSSSSSRGIPPILKTHIINMPVQNYNEMHLQVEAGRKNKADVFLKEKNKLEANSSKFDKPTTVKLTQAPFYPS